MEGNERKVRYRVTLTMETTYCTDVLVPDGANSEEAAINAARDLAELADPRDFTIGPELSANAFEVEGPFGT
jgi:hypothetical protein